MKITMKSVRYLGAILFLVGTVVACKKLPNGFISDGLRYEESPITIPRGRTKTSTALNIDGSTQPVTVKVIHFYNSTTGAIADDLFKKEYTIKGWTAVYNPLTDTTEAAIRAKQKDIVVNPITVNAVSGQVEANYTSNNLPLGSYHFDLEIANSAGIKTYPKIGAINIVDAPKYETPTPASNGARKVGDETVNVALASPLVTINKVGSDENKVILKYVDKNNIPFNPLSGEITYRPQPGLTTGSLQTMKMYAMKTTLFNDRTEFSFGTVPFPYLSLGNGFNYYYRIPTQFIHFDNPKLIDNQYSANPRFSFQSFDAGVYEIVVKLTDLSHR